MEMLSLIQERIVAGSLIALLIGAWAWIAWRFHLADKRAIDDIRRLNGDDDGCEDR